MWWRHLSSQTAKQIYFPRYCFRAHQLDRDFQAKSRVGAVERFAPTLFNSHSRHRFHHRVVMGLIAGFDESKNGGELLLRGYEF